MTQLMTAQKLSKSEMQAVQGGNFLLLLLAGCSGGSAKKEPQKGGVPDGWCPVEGGLPDEIEPCEEVQQNPDGSGCTDRKIPF